MNITVTGKGNLGYSPKFGEILEGQEYTIAEEDFAPELFNLPGKKQNNNPKGGDEK